MLKDKVGLVTFYGDNYGGLLQAYALQQTINRMDFKCEIMKYDWISPESKTEKYIKKFLQIESIFAYMEKRRIMRANFKNFAIRAQQFQKFRNDYLSFDHNSCVTIEDYYKNTPEFDFYVCGSDQIWNPNLYGRCNPIYFLDFVRNGKRKISYAPSIGVAEIEQKYKKEIDESEIIKRLIK